MAGHTASRYDRHRQHHTLPCGLVDLAISAPRNSAGTARPPNKRQITSSSLILIPHPSPLIPHPSLSHAFQRNSLRPLPLPLPRLSLVSHPFGSNPSPCFNRVLHDACICCSHYSRWHLRSGCLRRIASQRRLFARWGRIFSHTLKCVGAARISAGNSTKAD